MPVNTTTVFHIIIVTCFNCSVILRHYAQYDNAHLSIVELLYYIVVPENDGIV
jgi:hypothetical protein